MQVRPFTAALIFSTLVAASSVFAATSSSTLANKPANANSSTSTSSQPTNNQSADISKVSYSIGYTMGTNLIEQFKQLNQAELFKGFQQGISGAEPTITKDEMQKILISFQRQAMQEQYADMKKLADANKEEANKFLAENKAKPGVTTTSSGLQYRILSKGTGPTPKDSDRVFVNYSGKLLNGDVFSTSAELGDKPAAFVVNSVIPAWREALKLMPKGSKWEVVAPANLAYGERGTHGKIGPNATLIFTIELVDIDNQNAKKS